MRWIVVSLILLFAVPAVGQSPRRGALLRASLSQSAPEPPTTVAYGLWKSDQELAIWQDRMVNGPFKTTDDYLSLNVIGDYDLLKSRADQFKANPAWERYTNFYTGAPPWPGGNDPCYYPFWSTDTRVRGLDAAAFYYYLTGDESYAAPVRDELVAYASNPYLYWGNRTIFPIGYGAGGWGSQGAPYFNLASWVYRMLEAYDYTDSSSHYSTADHALLAQWFTEAGTMWMLYNQNDLETSWIQGRQSNNYRINPSQDPVTGDDTYGVNGRIYDAYGYYEGGPYNHWFSILWNNRQTKGQLMMFAVGIKYDNQTFIDEGIRTFKECIAYGQLADGTCNEFHRGQPTKPELGLGYTSSFLPDLVQMADLYARHYSTELYDYQITATDSIKYYGANSDKYWFSLYANTGNSLKTMIDNFLKYYAGDDGWGTSRYFSHGSAPGGKDYIDGLDYYANPDSYLERDYLVWMANTYYQDPHIDSVINRQISNQRSPLVNESGVSAGLEGGGVGAFNGYWNTQNWSHFRWGNMSGQVYPYVATDTIYFVNTVTPSDNEYVTVTMNRGAYANSNNTGALVAADLDVTFAQNGGTMTAWAVDSVVHTAGSAVLTIHGTGTGSADGNEYVTVEPVTASIYNSEGTAMNTANNIQAYFNAISTPATNDSSATIAKGDSDYAISTARLTAIEPGDGSGPDHLYVDFWIKPVTNNLEGTIVSVSDPGQASYQWYVIKWESDHASIADYVSLYIYDNTGGYIEIRSGEALTMDAWQHVAFRWDSSQGSSAGLDYFLNGVKKTNVTRTCLNCDLESGIKQDVDLRLQLGRRRAFSYYDGEIDDMWIMTGTVLSDSDVSNRYSGSSKFNATAHPDWNAAASVYLQFENTLSDEAGTATMTNNGVTFSDDTP